MRRISLGLILGSLGAFLVLGCGGGGRNDEDDYALARRTTGKGGAAKVQRPTRKPIEAKEYGVLKGKITWTGGDTRLEEERAAFLRSIEGKTDHEYCLTGKLPGGAEPQPKITDLETTQQSFRVGNNKGLGNVFVWIEPVERGLFFKIPKEQLDAVSKEVRLRQPHCAFLPHCSVLFPTTYDAEGKPVPTGQKFIIENDASVAHNASIVWSTGSQNFLIPAKGNPVEWPLRPDRSAVSIKCSIHGWMSAFVRVHDHPYAAVSSVGADPKSNRWEDPANPQFGTYEIKGVPVGVKVKLFAWHEILGDLAGRTGKEIVLQKETVENFEAQPR